jgi:hypothetical protein
MTRPTSQTPPKPQAAQDPRAARLKAAMKANIAKRKAQARARSAPSGSETDQNQNADKRA